MEGKPFNIRNVSASVQVFNYGSTASLASNIVVVALARMDLSIADETMRWRLLLWSFISYGGIGAQLNTRWDCSICSLFSTGAEVVQRVVFNDDSAHSFAIMGMTSLSSSSPTWKGTASTAAFPLALNNAIIIAFRGTDGSLFTPQDFLTDADVYPVLLGNHICPTCTFVRQGFYTKAMNLITTNGLGAAFIALLAANPNANIFVAGHSLGGALASQFAMWVIDYLHTNNLFRAQVGLYTFGQPPVGDASYTQCLQGNLPAIHRQIHFQDPVPNAFATVFFSTLLVLADAALEFPALSAVLLTCPQLINVDQHTDVVYSYAESLGNMVAFPYPRFSLAPNTTCLSSSDVRCHGNSSFRLFFTDYGVAFHRLGYFGVQLLNVSFYASCPLPCLSGSTCPMRITAAQLPGTISCSCDFSQYFTEGTQDETISYLRYKTPNCEDVYPGPPAVLHTWPTSTLPQRSDSALVGSPPVSLHLMDQELTPSWDPTLTLQAVAAACGVPDQRVMLLGATAGSVLATFQVLIDPTVDVDANGTFMSLTSLLVASSTPGELQQLVHAQPWAAPPLALFLNQIAAGSFNVSGEVVNASQVALLPPVSDPVLVDIQPRVLPIPNANLIDVVVLTLSGSGFLPPNSSQEASTVFQAPTVLNALQAPVLLLQNTVPPINTSTPSIYLALSNITRVNDSTLLVTVLLSLLTPNVSYTFTLSRENATLSQSLQATFTQQTPSPMALSSSASLASRTISSSSSSALVSSSSVGADTGSALLTLPPHSATSSFMPSAIAGLSSASSTSLSRLTASSTTTLSPASCSLAPTSSFSYPIFPVTSSFSTAEGDSGGSSGGSENSELASSTGAAAGGSTTSSPSAPLNIILPVVLGSAGLVCFVIIACWISARNSRKRGSEMRRRSPSAQAASSQRNESIEIAMVERKAPYGL